MVPPGSGCRPWAMLLSSTLLTLSLVTTARGQFHPDCSTQEALSCRRCCPVSIDGSVCGNHTKRGTCQHYQLQKCPPLADKRCNWPYEMFDEICSCNGNYGGADCGDCKPHYHGANCSEYIPCVRQELRKLTAAEKKQFLNTLCLAKNTTYPRCVILSNGTIGNVSTYRFQPASGYDCFTSIHANAAAYIKIGEKWLHKDMFHYGPAFCTAHRYLLLQFERMMQMLSGNKSFCIPYWDWTQDNNTCAVCSDDLLGRVGPNGTILPPSCFADWKIACGHANVLSFCEQEEDPSQRAPLKRNSGVIKMWPTAAEVNDSLKWPVYDRSPFFRESPQSFRSIIEGYTDAATGNRSGDYMHRQVHGEMGGVMNDPILASNDPIFYCHHAQIDRIYAMWQWIYCKTPADYPENDYPCQGPNDVIFPSMPPVVHKLFMNSPEYFGYSYSDKKHWPAPKCRGSSGAPEGGNTTSQ